MKVSRPIKEIRRRCRSEKLDIDEKTIDKVLEFYEDYMFGLLSSGEELRIANIGKITPAYKTLTSNLVSRHTAKFPNIKINAQEYDTVKFSFKAFEGLKSACKTKIAEIKKKHLQAPPI